MTGFSLGCWIVINFIVTALCWLIVNWADFYLFTYLGTDDDGKRLFMYHTLSIPARIFAFVSGVMAITLAVVGWAELIFFAII